MSKIVQIRENLLAGGLISVLTAMARMTGMSGRLIEATMGAMAHRSAQMPTGVLATSTFEPVWYVPFERRTHAPTRKLEYGPGRDISVTDRFYVCVPSQVEGFDASRMLLSSLLRQ